MMLATWNVNSVRARLPHLEQWLERDGPHVVALQETKAVDADFPYQPLQALGYHVVHRGQKSYNGVAVLSREPVEVLIDRLPGDDADGERRLLAVRTAGIVVVDCYVPNGSAIGSDKYAYKLAWLERLREYLAALLPRERGVAVVGDFNVAPEDRDVHDPQAWQGQVLVSEPERAALRRLFDLGLVDAWRLQPHDDAEGYTWWDYRAGRFRRNHGLRIDLVLLDQALARACTGARVVRELRARGRPSDHAPVVVELDLPRSGPKG